MTITTIIPSQEQQAAQVLTNILGDEKQSITEKRSDYRELLFVPVQVSQAEFESTVSGFTRDVSAGGVCLIMPQPFRHGTDAQIKLFGQASEESSAARCCWNVKFGNAYWVSGWRLKQRIPVGRLLKEDRLVEPEQRGDNRLQAAVPVSIYLLGSTSRIAGFTRNLSPEGLCLVSKVATQVGQIADLDVMRLNGESIRIVSRCLWSKQYGEDNWVSGWQFKS